MSGWYADLGPTNQGPPDRDTRCASCSVDLEDGDHEPWCECVVWGEPEGAGVACECGSFMHGRC